MRSLIAILVGSTVLVAPLAAKEMPKPEREPERLSNKGCEYLGPGYSKAPGSDTCIKVGGLVRVEGSVITNR